MVDLNDSLVAVVMMSAVVYLTRAGGYFLGLQIRHFKRLQPLLETLPGCAMAAILAPAIRQGNVVELVGLAMVILIMWKMDNVAVASLVGIGCLLLGPSLMSS